MFLTAALLIFAIYGLIQLESITKSLKAISQLMAHEAYERQQVNKTKRGLVAMKELAAEEKKNVATTNQGT